MVVADGDHKRRVLLARVLRNAGFDARFVLTTESSPQVPRRARMFRSSLPTSIFSQVEPLLSSRLCSGRATSHLGFLRVRRRRSAPRPRALKDFYR